MTAVNGFGWTDSADIDGDERVSPLPEDLLAAWVLVADA